MSRRVGWMRIELSAEEQQEEFVFVGGGDEPRPRGKRPRRPEQPVDEIE